MAYWIYWVWSIAVAVLAISGICLSISGISSSRKLSALLHPYTIAGFMCLLLCTLITLGPLVYLIW